MHRDCKQNYLTVFIIHGEIFILELSVIKPVHLIFNLFKPIDILKSSFSDIDECNVW